MGRSALWLRLNRCEICRICREQVECNSQHRQSSNLQPFLHWIMWKFKDQMVEQKRNIRSYHHTFITTHNYTWIPSKATVGCMKITLLSPTSWCFRILGSLRIIARLSSIHILTSLAHSHFTWIIWLRNRKRGFAHSAYVPLMTAHAEYSISSQTHALFTSVSI